MSYERTQAAMLELHGVRISEGGIDGIMQRAGEAALEEVKLIEEAVRQSAVVNSDETGARVNGQNWWQWVFCTATVILHLIRNSRAAQVIERVMGGVIVWGRN